MPAAQDGLRLRLQREHALQRLGPVRRSAAVGKQLLQMVAIRAQPRSVGPWRRPLQVVRESALGARTMVSRCEQPVKLVVCPRESRRSLCARRCWSKPNQKIVFPPRFAGAFLPCLRNRMCLKVGAQFCVAPSGAVGGLCLVVARPFRWRALRRPSDHSSTTPPPATPLGPPLSLPPSRGMRQAPPASGPPVERGKPRKARVDQLGVRGAGIWNLGPDKKRISPPICMKSRVVTLQAAVFKGRDLWQQVILKVVAMVVLHRCSVLISHFLSPSLTKHSCSPSASAPGAERTIFRVAE